MQALQEAVDGFTVMTYDANREAPGFNAPLPWVQKNVKLLLDEDYAASQDPKGHYGEYSKPCDSFPGISISLARNKEPEHSL